MNLVFNGLSLASIILLASLGLAITFGLMRVINMAHGEFMMIGAYTTYVVQGLAQKYISKDAADLGYFLSIFVAFAVTFLIGSLLETLVVSRLYGREIDSLLATWGISLILQYLRNTGSSCDNTKDSVRKHQDRWSITFLNPTFYYCTGSTLSALCMGTHVPYKLWSSDACSYAAQTDGTVSWNQFKKNRQPDIQHWFRTCRNRRMFDRIAWLNRFHSRTELHCKYIYGSCAWWCRKASRNSTWIHNYRILKHWI